jgi:hypothetical protein
MIGVLKETLGKDVVEAVARAREGFKNNTLDTYDGNELNDSQVDKRGAKFFKIDVGEARPEDAKGKRGSRRLIVKVQSGRLTEMYLTDDHYSTGSWRKLININ